MSEGNGCQRPTEASLKEQGFSTIQRRMMMLLSDGEPHSKEELFGCLNDHLGEVNSVRKHIMKLRIKLEAFGQWIAPEIKHRQCSYRLVRLLHSANDGKR